VDGTLKLEVEIARLQEQIIASATALKLAQALAAAELRAERAQVHSNWSSALSIISLLIAIATLLWSHR
jgi:hypothetical protein